MRKTRFSIRTIAVLLLFVSFVALLDAQISYGGRPPGLEADNVGYAPKSIGRNNHLQRVQLPPIDSARIFGLEEAYASHRLRGAIPFAVERVVSYNPFSSGAIYVDSRGCQVWRLWVQSAGAQSLNFTFDRFKLPQGARLFIYTPDGKSVLGAFTQANNPGEAPFATAPIAGDEAILECVLPVGMTFDTFVGCGGDLHLSAIHHDYKGFFDITSSFRAHKDGEPWFTTKGLSCAPPVVSHPEVDLQARSTVLVIARGGLVFSGALINNTQQDATPYVLTASHCMNGNFANENNLSYARSTAATCVFFFGFDSPSATTMIRGSQEKTLSGAYLTAFNEDYDLCLLRITGLPKDAQGKTTLIPPSYMPYFSGWNIAPSPVGPFVGIHHPSAAVKRYNRSDAEGLVLGSFDAGRVKWENKHWYIRRWDVGTTAGGSSGSPLFDKDGLIIGALSGGQSYCTSPINDFYYALTLAFRPQGEQAGERMLAQWLDPQSTGRTTLQGYDPYAPHSARRISRVMRSANKKEIEALSIDDNPNLSGVATGYQFPSKVRILGAHIVMEGAADITTAAQFLTLQFSILKGEKKPDSEVYSSIISHPSYVFWNAQSGSFDSKIRTLIDTLDFFVPIRTPEGGNFIDIDGPVNLYAAIRTIDGVGALRLPILRLKREDAGAQAAYHLSSGANDWITASSDIPAYRGNYWIDLLVQPIGEEGGLPLENDKVTIRMKDNALRMVAISLPVSDETPVGTVHIYDYAGQCLYSTHIKGYRNTINVYDLLGSGSFILQLDYAGRKYIQKLQIQ